MPNFIKELLDIFRMHKYQYYFKILIASAGILPL